MGFIIRSAFWLSLVLMLIPVEGQGSPDQPSVSPIQALLAARDAVADLTGMCERKPDVCDTGRTALNTIGMRARESARFAYEMLEKESSAPDAMQDEALAATGDAAPDTAISTGSVTSR